MSSLAKDNPEKKVMFLGNILVYKMSCLLSITLYDFPFHCYLFEVLSPLILSSFLDHIQHNTISFENLCSFLDPIDLGMIFVKNDKIVFANSKSFRLFNVDPKESIKLRVSIEEELGFQFSHVQAETDIWTRGKGLPEKIKRPKALEFKGNDRINTPIVNNVIGRAGEYVLVIREVQEAKPIAPNKAKSSHKKMMLISLSHEFRTPLNGFINASSY